MEAMTRALTLLAVLSVLTGLAGCATRAPGGGAGSPAAGGTSAPARATRGLGGWRDAVGFRDGLRDAGGRPQPGGGDPQPRHGRGRSTARPCAPAAGRIGPRGSRPAAAGGRRPARSRPALAVHRPSAVREPSRRAASLRPMDGRAVGSGGERLQPAGRATRDHRAERADASGLADVFRGDHHRPALGARRAAGPPLPAACRAITTPQYPGAVKPTTVPAPGPGALSARAFEVTGTGKFPVWTWAEVIRGRGFLMEIRIPNQSANSDPGAALTAIGANAYARAAAVLA